MAKKEKPQIAAIAIWMQRLRRLTLITLRFLSGTLFRLCTVGLAIVLSGYLLYVFAVSPLQEDVELPPTVSQRNPVINNDALADINNRRIERTSRQARSYAGFSRVFLAIPVPAQ